jgi:predicted MFS family arabinose efflux permease
VGNALVLFARSLDISASWVGFLIAFMPLSMLLVVTTVPLVTHLGPRRLMSVAWGSRCVVICAVFLIPYVLREYGLRPAQFVLMGSTLAFCLLRAMGGGAWFPWLHEVVPIHQRGTYFSTESAITQLLWVLVASCQALILQNDPGMYRFLAIYSIGIAAGFISLIYMVRVPGGRGVKERDSVHSSYAAYRVSLSDRPFLWFVVVATLCFASLTWLSAALVLYMRDALGYSPRDIMLLTAAAGAGILVTIRQWGRYADHSGSGHAMLLSLAGHSAAALVFLVLTPDAWWTAWLLPPTVVLVGILAAAFTMAAHRAMLNFVRSPGRVAYTNLWTVGTSLALGVTPILVGFCIEHWDLWGYRICFLSCAVGGICCAVACRFAVPDSGPLQRSLGQLINPALPMRTLARIMWITLGMHESVRAPGLAANLTDKP